MSGVWLTSSSCVSGECVQVQITPSWVFVRNSDGGPVVTASYDEWRSFIAGAAAGEFDLPEEQS